MGVSEHILAPVCCVQARLAQSAERKALNLVVVGSSPTVGVLLNVLDVYVRMFRKCVSPC